MKYYNRMMMVVGVVCVNAFVWGRDQYLNYGNATWCYDDTTYTYTTSVGIKSVSISDSTTEVTMPTSVYIGSKSYPFALSAPSLAGGKNLVTFNVPVGVVGSFSVVGTFSGCDNLRYINIASAHETHSSLDGVVYDKSGKRLIIVPNAMTEFTVPSSVTNVSEDAFLNCKGLSAIDVEDGNDYYASVDGVLYNKAMTELIRCPREKDNVSILDTVTSIGSGAFRMCTNLTEVILPESVRNIADSAFTGCSGLTELELPASVTNIGSSAFGNCNNLHGVVLPESVVGIGSSAFSGCTALTEIEFPESISDIRPYTFNGCTGLSRVVLPSTITNLDNRAFAGCSGVRSVTVPQSICSTNRLATIFPAAYSRITDVIIAEGTTIVGDGLFSGCANLVNLVIPDCVTSISTNAFKNCDKFNANLYVRQLKGVFGPDAETGVRYSLGDVVKDRAIVSVTVNGDAAIDEFVMVDGKVYDCAVRIVNTAATVVTISLPSGYEYESFVGAAPLKLPAHSTNMLTITRTGERTFLVARRQLQSIGL